MLPCKVVHDVFSTIFFSHLYYVSQVIQVRGKIKLLQVLVKGTVDAKSKRMLSQVILIYVNNKTMA